MIDKILVDELGSGVRNIHKYGKFYFGYEPQIIEAEIFKIVFKTSDNSITHQDTHQVTHQVTHQADNRIKALIKFCEEPRTRVEMQEFTGIKDRTHFRIKILKPLIDAGIIKLTTPDKPRSPNQKYYSVKIHDQNDWGVE